MYSYYLTKPSVVHRFPPLFSEGGKKKSREQIMKKIIQIMCVVTAISAWNCHALVLSVETSTTAYEYQYVPEDDETEVFDQIFEQTPLSFGIGASESLMVSLSAPAGQQYHASLPGSGWDSYGFSLLFLIGSDFGGGAGDHTSDAPLGISFNDFTGTALPVPESFIYLTGLGPTDPAMYLTVHYQLPAGSDFTFSSVSITSSSPAGFAGSYSGLALGYAYASLGSTGEVADPGLDLFSLESDGSGGGGGPAVPEPSTALPLLVLLFVAGRLRRIKK